MGKTRLQELRKAKGYKSARVFAEKIGMPVRTYTNYEQGDREMSIEVAWRIADELECSIDELVGRDWHED